MSVEMRGNRCNNNLSLKQMIYFYTTKIRTVNDNNIKINKMEFIIIMTMWLIVKIAEKLAKIEEI